MRERPASLDTVAAGFAKACEDAGVGYVLVGGFAVLAWGQPRTTSDIDALVDYGEEDVQPLAGSLEGQGLEVEERDLRLALKDGSHVTVFTGDPVLTVDIKPALATEERMQIEAGVEVALEPGPANVADPADTVAYKVLFGSDQDLQDARSIVARQGGRLDRQRLRRVAQGMGVLEATNDLVAEVDELLADDPEA